MWYDENGVELHLNDKAVAIDIVRHWNRIDDNANKA